MIAEHHSAPAFLDKASAHGERDAREGKPSLTYDEARAHGERGAPDGMSVYWSGILYAFTYAEGYRAAADRKRLRQRCAAKL